jgi:hypothetical protein
MQILMAPHSKSSLITPLKSRFFISEYAKLNGTLDLPWLPGLEFDLLAGACFSALWSTPIGTVFQILALVYSNRLWLLGGKKWNRKNDK